MHHTSKYDLERERERMVTLETILGMNEDTHTHLKIPHNKRSGYTLSIKYDGVRRESLDVRILCHALFKEPSPGRLRQQNKEKLSSFQ